MAKSRVALVIAEASYQHATRLRTPPNDTTAVAKALRDIGFDTVTVRENLDANEMRSALTAFGAEARKADVAIIYYAGHGMEIGGTNYLIPVDAKLATDVDVALEAISLDVVQGVVSQSSGLKIIILDACRDNPFANRMQRTSVTRSVSRGLARVETRDDGMLVAYSAAAGQTALDGDGPQSPFAEAFVSELTSSTEDVRIMFGAVQDAVKARTGGMQVPAVYATLGGRHYILNGKAKGSSRSDEAQALAASQVASTQPSPGTARTEAQAATAAPVPALAAYRNGERAYSDANFAEAVTWFRQAADEGNPDAQNSLGNMYVKGEGVPQDYRQAMVWFRKSADQGNTDAQNNMGVMYEYGQGVPKDYNQAMTWYRKAANQGHAEAQHNIGALYQGGRGITQNYSQAAAWYRKAAEQGLPAAQNDLATLYQYGWGVPQDSVEAREWFQKARKANRKKDRKAD